MRKVTFIVSLTLVLNATLDGAAQTSTKTESLVGKWGILVAGTPYRDSKVIADLAGNGAKLSGQLTNPADPTGEKIPLTIEENGNRIILAFSTCRLDVTMDLEKVDDHNLKGNLMSMLDTTAKRLK